MIVTKFRKLGAVKQQRKVRSSPVRSRGSIASGTGLSHLEVISDHKMIQRAVLLNLHRKMAERESSTT